MSEQESMNVILSRMNHQDKTLDEIKRGQAEMKGRMEVHLAMEAEVKPSIDELISVLHGSKMLGRFVLYVCSLLGAGWALVTWAKDHVKL